MCLYCGGIYAVTVLMSNRFKFPSEEMVGEVCLFCFFYFWSPACCSSASLSVLHTVAVSCLTISTFSSEIDSV